MKILVLASTYPRWKNDTEPGFVHKLNKTISNGARIHVLAPHTKGAKRSEEIDGIKVFRYRYAPDNWQKIAYDGGISSNLSKNRLNFILLPFFILAQVYYIRKLNRLHSYDLIHAHWIIPQGLAARLALSLPFGKSTPKLLITSHGGDMYAWNSSITSKIKSWVLSKAESIAVVSSAMKNYAEEKLGIPPNKINIAPMGVDLSGTFKPNESNSQKREGIIFVGRLVEKKGVSHLLHAISMIMQQHNKKIPLKVIGNGPLKQQLEDLSEEIGISSFVTFYGAVENKNIPKLLQESEVAVIPSVVDPKGDQEGLGLTIIEAMGAECLTICSDLPAIHDIVKHGENGYLFEPGNAIKLADLIYEYYRDEATRVIAKAGRQSAIAKFNWPICAGRYVKLYETLKQ